MPLFSALSGNPLLSLLPARLALLESRQGGVTTILTEGGDDWLRFCRTHNLEPSMSRRGNCLDNAMAESFFSSLKKERIKKRIYRTRDLARGDILDSSRCSTIRPNVTATSVASARKRLNRHRFEGSECQRKAEKSTRITKFHVFLEITSFKCILQITSKC